MVLFLGPLRPNVFGKKKRQSLFSKYTIRNWENFPWGINEQKYSVQFNFMTQNKV